MAKEFDLEHFPVSPSAKKMMSYIPENIYYRSYVGKWIFEVMGQQMDVSKDIVDTLADQFFVDTATWGLIWHEEMFGLPMRPYDTDYEARRRRIRAKRDEKIPMSPWHMEEIIKDITGYDAHVYEINETNEDGFVPTHPNRFRVMIEGEELLNLSTVIDKIRKVKQSHTRFELAVSLMTILHENEVVPRVRFRFSAPWWDFLLNGMYKLDGEKFLGWKYPPSFWMAWYMHMAAQDTFGIAKLKHRLFMKILPRTVHRNTYRWAFPWWDWVLDGKYLLNGERKLRLTSADFIPVFRFPLAWNSMKLDGEYLLDGERFLGMELFEFMSADRFAVANKSDQIVKTRYRSAFVWWDWVLDGKYPLDGEKCLKTRNAEFGTVIRMSLMWHNWVLDGEYLLDGERVLSGWFDSIFSDRHRFVAVNEYSGGIDLNVSETFRTGLEIRTARSKWSRQGITMPVNTTPDKIDIGFNWLRPKYLNGAFTLNGATNLNGGREVL